MSLLFSVLRTCQILVETWLCIDILDTEISIPNYSIVRLDRNMHGGGVAMYIRNSVSYNVVMYGSAGLEVIVVSLSKGNFKLCVYSIDPPLPHMLFLIICVTFYFLSSSHIFLILYYLVTLMLILILLTVFILTFVTS